jgi:peptidoglycan/LPS O-acetylase OafA/YrhL
MSETASLAPAPEAVVPTPAPVSPRPSESCLRGYLPTLDGWRAIAILMVISSHERLVIGRSWLANGGIGVSIFFGLSGFLICSRLLEEHASTGGISLRGFYVRRAFRIFPAAWTYLAGLAVLTAVGALAVQPSEFLGSVFFFRNYYPATDRWYTEHFWSLAVEEHFYLLFPALLALCGTGRARWVVPLLALAVAAWRALDNRFKWLSDALPHAYPYFRTDFRLDSLLWGCWTAMLVARYHERLRGRLILAIGLVSAAVVIGSTSNVIQVPTAVLVALIPWMLAATVLRPRGVVGRVLELPPVRWIGRLSYSLYLWQQLFFVGWTYNLAPAMYPWQDFPWNVLALVSCASASYYLLERPLMRFGHRLAKPVSSGRV